MKQKAYQRTCRPRMGAWVEIELSSFEQISQSVAPVWGRGLKLVYGDNDHVVI